MIGNKGFIAVPFGLVGVSFALEFARDYFPTVHPKLVFWLFWLGITTLLLVVTMQVAIWGKWFLKEMFK